MNILYAISDALDARSKRPKKSRREQHNEILQWLIGVRALGFVFVMSIMTVIGIVLTVALPPLGLTSLAITWYFGIKALLWR